jgi:uncharacterized protein YkwD
MRNPFFYYSIVMFAAVLATTSSTVAVAHFSAVATPKPDLNPSYNNNTIIADTRVEQPSPPPNENVPILAPVTPNALEISVHKHVNDFRHMRGLPPISLDPLMTAYARAHSERMLADNRLSHDDFPSRVGGIRRVLKIGSFSAAENVAFNQGHDRPDITAVVGWIRSAGHNKNMIGDFNLTGVGMAVGRDGTFYFTQIFFKTPPPPSPTPAPAN